MKISGYTCVRNNFDLDYNVEQTIQSMLPICEEVVVSEGESTDGTREWLDDWATREPKLRIVTYSWPNPKGDLRYWTKWLNHAQAQLRYPMQLECDADEIVDPKSYPRILEAAKYEKCLWFKRLTFWRDAQHYAPDGHLVGSQVVRLCPTNVWMCSDEPFPEGEPECRLRAGWPPNGTDDCRILHYGFIRRNFIKKARVILSIAADTMDQRLEESERKGTPWQDNWTFEEPQGDDHHIVRAPVLEFTEPHPEMMHCWLKERGYNPG